ncbi:MAG: hypothetical protein JOY60_01935 [Burkholderiaceae bacterium]|nr:hypothetical protein [Roseateles sp.]MBV8468611.1 hypothetical protein [Burkholderiaceae bacterium]
MQELALLFARRLAEWHNRHPLARRVTADDVHSLGLVALPFMRSSATPSVEPVLSTLDDVVSPEELAAAQQGSQGGAGDEAVPDDPTLAVLTKQSAKPPAPAAAPLAVPVEAAPSPEAAGAAAGLRRWLARLPFLNGTGKSTPMWPVFSKSLIPGISARRAARFALLYGYRQAPDDGTLPRRVLSIDERLAAKPRGKGGAWPTEIYLLSAAIDAGSARTRVILAQGPGQTVHVTGPRCLDPLRLGLTLTVLLGLPALAASLWWWHSAEPAATPPAPVSAAASAAASMAATTASSAAAAVPVPAASAASQPFAQASAPAEPPASAATVVAPAIPAPSAPSPAAKPLESASIAQPGTPAKADGKTQAILSASEQIMSGQTGDNRAQPDIRPHLEPTVPRLVQRNTINPAANADAGKNKPDGASEHGRNGPAAPAKPTPQAEPPKGERTQFRNPKSGEEPGQVSVENMKQVALVGPPMPSKDEALAYLQRMQNMAAPLIGAKSMQSQVFQTPEGWRAAIWPFGSREEAQLINATLIARGLHTKAIDF